MNECKGYSKVRRQRNENSGGLVTDRRTLSQWDECRQKRAMTERQEIRDREDAEARKR